MAIKFGCAGNPQSFYDQGHKHSYEMPAWLKDKGLNAYEYSCGRGVRIRQETAGKIGAEAAEHGISLSIHAPYYINLSSTDEKIIASTQEHMLKALRAARWMGATRVVFHPGAGKGDRSGAMQRAREALTRIVDLIRAEDLDDIWLCPETMGKVNQLGSLDEVLELCTLAPNLRPTIDFGHINAVTQGSLAAKEDFAAVLSAIEKRLGTAVLTNLHCHFSPVEFTKAGEKKHWTTLDTQFGPSFEPLAVILAENDYTPTIICESDGRQAEDALVYKNMYLQQRELIRK